MKVATFLSLVFLGHILIWFQSNGQLLWKAFRENPLLISLFGVPFSLMFIQATKIGYEIFNENLWPVRIIGFTVGTIVFSFMTYFFLGEAISIKTGICLVLCIIIILVQVAL
tara:strand:- start:686 stop:1021 length:336 start_codon:yes stop_codon:yes gene_type:complete